MSLTPSQSLDVVRIARSWLGTPYHHRARIKGAGVDCGMIVIEVFSEAGIISNFDPGDYTHDWMMHRSQERYLKVIETYAEKVNRPPMPGDVALFRFGRCISHGAIVTDWPNIIHSYKPVGCVVEDNVEMNAALENKFVGVWCARG